METLCALIRGDLAPAGNKIALTASSDTFDYSIQGYESHWVDSGTSALALALADVKAKSPHTVNPSVIIPGYCCPDLVAAAIYAGVRPVAVDICANDAGYDLAALKTAIDANTVAVIAVNFLGIKERLDEIRTLLANTSIKLIEDNAQWFPASISEHAFLSDYVLFTFGRGKPLSLLGGGVLFFREPLMVADLVQPLARDPAYDVKQHGKLLAYNFLLHPHCYCYLNRAPFLHLGETCYHPLPGIFALDAYRKTLFAANLLLHANRPTIAEQFYDELGVGKQQLTSVNTIRRKRLLRYPLLCESVEQRDRLLKQLNGAGLGASPMYQTAITHVPGVHDLVVATGGLDNSHHFARRFLTLPTHEYVTEKQLQRIKAVLDKIF